MPVSEATSLRDPAPVHGKAAERERATGQFREIGEG